MKHQNNPQKVTSWSIIRHFFSFYRKQRFFYPLLLSSIFWRIAAGLDIFISANIVNAVSGYFSHTATFMPVWHWTFLLISTGFLSWVFGRLTEYCIMKFQIGVMTDVTDKAFSYMYDHSHQYFSDTFVGSIYKKLSRYVRSFEDFSDLLIFRLSPLIIGLIITTTIIMSSNTLTGGIFIIWVSIFSVATYFFQKWKHVAEDIHDRVDSRVTGEFSDVLSNHSTMSAFGTAKEEHKKLMTSYREVTDALRNSWIRGNWMYASMGAISYLSYWGVLLFTIHLILQGDITFAAYLIINMANGTFTDNIWTINDIFKMGSKNIADAREGREILTTPHSVKDNTHAKNIAVSEGQISFDHVVFGYHPDRVIFPDLSLTIAPHEKVALVGTSGSGKSTLIKLLMRWYDIQAGTIAIDGENISNVTQVSLRKSIALVPQDPSLFHRTLRENISYARPDISEEEFARICRISRCDEFIRHLTSGYESLVGERGVKLSGGERQRVAIARALVSGAPILIFDEATSALDSESERIIQEAMFDAMEGKTTIVIAHRLSTITHMDRIIVFEEGRIIETGTHAELSKKPDGVYAKLWSIQSGEFRE